MKIQEDSLIPKYHQIKDFLLSYIKINNLCEGDPLPSESSLMKEYKVSRNTIRLAFELLVKEGLAEKQQGKGTFYRDPRSRKSRKTGMIGLIAPLSHLLIQEALLPLEELFYQRGYTLLLGNSSDKANKEETLLERFTKRNIEGLLIHPLSKNHSDFLRKTLIPYVLIEEAEESVRPYISLAEDLINKIESEN